MDWLREAVDIWVKILGTWNESGAYSLTPPRYIASLIADTLQTLPEGALSPEQTEQVSQWRQ